MLCYRRNVYISIMKDNMNLDMMKELELGENYV